LLIPFILNSVWQSALYFFAPHVCRTKGVYG
jgi:hypothetical protein